jgi:hypothetical protein
VLQSTTVTTYNETTHVVHLLAELPLTAPYGTLKGTPPTSTTFHRFWRPHIGPPYFCTPSHSTWRSRVLTATFQAARQMHGTTLFHYHFFRARTPSCYGVRLEPTHLLLLPGTYSTPKIKIKNYCSPHLPHAHPQPTYQMIKILLKSQLLTANHSSSRRVRTGTPYYYSRWNTKYAHHCLPAPTRVHPARVPDVPTLRNNITPTAIIRTHK